MTTAHETHVVDPVCGMTITTDEAVGSATHKGTRYYFCHESCLERFTADPEQFLSPPASADATSTGTAVSGQGVLYTCPMHPEIVQDHPGSCPKCGMALEPVTPLSVEEVANPELRDMTMRFAVAAVFALPLLLIT